MAPIPGFRALLRGMVGQGVSGGPFGQQMSAVQESPREVGLL
jgi:hypothetical protein